MLVSSVDANLEKITLASSVVNAKILGASRETKLFVSHLLSYEVEGAEHNSMFKSGSWDGRSSFFDYKSATFSAGFTNQVASELRQRGHQLQFVTKPSPDPLGPEPGTVDPLGYGFIERYDYQLETVKRLIRYKRMIARVATGGGKSNIAVLSFASIRRMTLFLTTRGSLMYQMKKNFENAGFNPGVIGDSILQPRNGVNVAMVQTISAWLSEPLAGDKSPEADKQRERRRKMIDLLHKVEFVIGEEAHEAGGNSYYEILSHCVNAHYRLALTATPFMRDDAEANMRLQAAFGSIGIDISEKLLIDRGILAKPYFKFLSTPLPNHLRKSTRWPTCRDIGIVENVGRNKLIVKESIELSNHGRNVLVLIRQTKHGALLNDMLNASGLRSTFIYGDNNQSERAQALKALNNHEIDILVASSILDVGVDVPALGGIIMGGAGKAEVGHRQRIGRGLREKKTGDNNCFLVDFEDEGNTILKSHATLRLNIIKNTPGFVEGILDKGVQFPY